MEARTFRAGPTLSSRRLKRPLDVRFDIAEQGVSVNKKGTVTFKSDRPL